MGIFIDLLKIKKEKLKLKIKGQCDLIWDVLDCEKLGWGKERISYCSIKISVDNLTRIFITVNYDDTVRFGIDDFTTVKLGMFDIRFKEFVINSRLI